MGPLLGEKGLHGSIKYRQESAVYANEVGSVRFPERFGVTDPRQFKAMAAKKLQIVVPVFNDWDSFERLLDDIGSACAALAFKISVIGVDDGSTDSLPPTLRHPKHFTTLSRVEILKLGANVGHQRAIAVGLSRAVAETDADAFVVMDSDGEDRPRDIPRLLDAASGLTEFAVVAERRLRATSALFKLLYALYKMTFAILTGANINFGNFCLISRGYAERLVMTADLWNNLPAALLRSRVPIVHFPADRGPRYAGTSKMNYVSLIVHGMSGISVYSDAIFVRMLIATGGLALLSAVAITAIVAIRLFTDLATPGWATTVVFGVVILMFQAIVSTLTTMLLLLNNRSQRAVVPARDYGDHVLASSVLFASKEVALDLLQHG
ncbi:MAG TPA: glycosyltransferase [Stellaceae bacterium]|nr:glycosyltransferase [Stellaceae bacterium]